VATEITPPSSIRIAETEHGRGVIAIAEIEQGETIEVSPLLVLGEGEASGLLDDYTVSLGEDGPGVVLLLGYGSLYNHSDDPNAEYVAEADDAYTFVALRDIEVGEQITISYGEEWWRTREG
jgi:SET domain-containing protein